MSPSVQRSLKTAKSCPCLPTHNKEEEEKEPPKVVAHVRIQLMQEERQTGYIMRLISKVSKARLY